MERRRHQISSIDELPEEATGLIDVAIAALADGRQTDTVILAEFNEALAELDIAPISRAAFGRYALRKRKAFASIKATREAARAVAAELGPDTADETTQLIAELIKTAVHDNLMRGHSSAKELADMSRALNAANAARKAARGERSAKQREDREMKAAEAVVGAVAQAHPQLDGEAILQKIRAIYRGEA
jgi:hypothetical protein